MAKQKSKIFLDENLNEKIKENDNLLFKTILSFLDENKEISAKIKNISHTTPGNSKKNSPIKNRMRRTFETIFDLLETQKNKQKNKQNKTSKRIAIKKVEASCIEEMDLIYDNLLMDILCMKNFPNAGKFINIFNVEYTKCYLCGDLLDYRDFCLENIDKNTDRIVADHISPKSEEIPKNISGNISWTHKICNSIKGEHEILEFLNKIEKINPRKEEIKKTHRQAEEKCDNYTYDENNRVIRKRTI